jgi:hypothetical protein
MEPDHFFEIHRQQTVRKLTPQVLLGSEGELADIFKVSNFSRFYPSVSKDFVVVRRFTRPLHGPLQALQLEGGEGFSGHSLAILIPVHYHLISKREH